MEPVRSPDPGAPGHYTLEPREPKLWVFAVFAVTWLVCVRAGFHVWYYLGQPGKDPMGELVVCGPAGLVVAVVTYAVYFPRSWRLSPRALLVAAVFGLLTGLSAIALRICHDGWWRPGALEQTIDRCDRVVVLESAMSGAPVLYESADSRDLRALKAATAVLPPDQPRHCCCSGRPAIVLYSGSECVARVTIHHARSLRCGVWRGDVPVRDPEALLRWFDDRNMPGPRAERDEAEEARRRLPARVPR